MLLFNLILMFIIYSAKVRIKNDTTKYFVLMFVNRIDLFSLFIYHSQDKLFEIAEGGIQNLISVRLNLVKDVGFNRHLITMALGKISCSRC